MGQSGSIPQVTRNYTDPLHLRLHFTYDPTTTEIYAKPRPYTAAQVATLVRTDWPSFFNKSIAFGGGCDSPEQHYTSDDTDIDKGRTCLDIPPKRIRLTSADIREVREVTPRDATTTARRFRIDIVTKLVKNTSEPVQAYLDAHQASRNKYLVRVGTSYPLDKLVHEAFATVQQHWMGGGWLQAVNQKRSTAGRGDIYPDTTRGASSWYQYVQETQGASRNTRKGTRATVFGHNPEEPEDEPPVSQDQDRPSHPVHRFS